MTSKDVFLIFALVGMGFVGGIIYKTLSTKMIIPTVECDAACEFDKFHGKPRPPWLTETMQVVSDLGNYWWIVEETVSGECLLMYRRTAGSGGTGKIGHFAVSTLNGESCSRGEIK